MWGAGFALVLSSGRLNVLAAGQLSLHDVYLVHNSRPNTSARRRAGLVPPSRPPCYPLSPAPLPLLLS